MATLLLQIRSLLTLFRALQALQTVLSDTDYDSAKVAAWTNTVIDTVLKVGLPIVVCISMATAVVYNMACVTQSFSVLLLFAFL